MRREVRRRGVRLGKERVRPVMRQHGIQARGKRRFRVATTDSKHSLPIAPNLLDRNFCAERPNRAWTGDVTYIATEGGWLHLAVVIDLFSRRIVGGDEVKHRPKLGDRRAGNGLPATPVTNGQGDFS
jgi:putative transposase